MTDHQHIKSYWDARNSGAMAICPCGEAWKPNDTPHIKRTFEYSADGTVRPDSAWIPEMLNDLAERLERLEREIESLWEMKKPND